MAGPTLAGKALVPFSGDLSGLMSGVASSVKDAGGMFSKMVPVAIVASIAGIAAGVVDLASKYASSTAQMASMSGITIKQANLIGSAFLSTGGQTEFSAAQMMQAFAPVSGQLELVNGKALTAAQSMTFMRASMALAEATGQSLGSTVTALAGVMQAYSLPVADAAKASDLLYNVSRSLDMPISDVASAVDKLHAKLGPLAPSLTDVGTLLLDVASHGLTGSRALMLVTTGMNTLLGGTKATTAELKTLGVNIYTSSGQFVGMQSVISQLAPKLAGLTEQQRLLAEKSLFGTTANKALDATIMAGLPAWDSAAKAADKTGTAQAGAAKATDNLAGMFDRFKSKVEDMAISLGQDLLPAVTTVFGFLLNSAVPAVSSIVGGIAGFIDKAGLLLPILAGVATLFAAWVASMVIGGAIALFTGAVAALLPLLAVLAPSLAASAAAMLGLDTEMDANPIGLIVIACAALVAGIVLLITHFNLVKQVASTVWTFIDGLITTVWNHIKGVVLPVLTVIEAAVTVAFNAIKTVISVVLAILLPLIKIWWTVVSTLFTVALNIIITAIKVAFAVITVAWNVLSTAVKIIVQALWDTVSQIFQIAAALVIGIVTGIATAITAIWNAIKGWVIPIVQGIGFAITLAFTVVRDTLAVIWSVISSVIKTVWGAITTVFTLFATTIGGIFTGIRTALSTVWTGIGNDVTGAWNGIVNVIKGAVNLIIGIIDGIIGGINTVTGLIPGVGSHLKIPLIPKWSSMGALVTSPTLIGAGEAGPEVVMNKPQFQEMAHAMGGLPGGGASAAAPALNMTVNLHGTDEAMVVKMQQVVSHAFTMFAQRAYAKRGR